MNDDYYKGLRRDSEKTKEYYLKSVVKTEQQKFLEKLLSEEIDSYANLRIADIACGAGTLSFHLAELFKNSSFTLIDYNEEAIALAQDVNRESRFSFHTDSIYELNNLSDNYFDMVFCWQTLSWLDQPKEALEQLLRILCPGGKLYLSALFNLDHDVDVYSKVKDFTRESGQSDIPFTYNTYSKKTIEAWVEPHVQQIQFHKFTPEIDFEYQGRGIGTYTKTCSNERLQFSAGMLLNWSILVIKK